MKNSFVRFASVALAAFAALAPLVTRAGLRAWEPTDYVRTDLALQLDGIRNAGLDAEHDSAATVWKDLSGQGRDAALTAGDGSKWNDAGDGFFFNKNAAFATTATFALGTKSTYEVLVDAVRSDWTADTYVLTPGADMNNGTIYYKKGNSILCYRTQNLNGSTWDTMAGYSSLDNMKYLVALRDDTRAALVTNAVYPTTSWSIATDGAIGYNASLGRNYVTEGGWLVGTKNDVLAAKTWTVGAQNASAGNGMKGTVKSVRVYDTLLTEAELAWNRAVDEARFFGAASVAAEPVASAPIPDAFIAADGNEARGSYLVDDSGYTFTAPATRTADGTTYELTGCTVATWDESTGAYGAAETRDGVYAVSVAAGDKVKITWQYSAASGSLGSGLSGYVTDGLELHFDGIDNIGTGVHSADTTVWKDLSGNGRDATLAGNADGTSYWTDKGFYFNKNAWFDTISKLSVGDTHTIEFLVDLDKANYTVSGVNGYVLYQHLTARNNTYGTVYYHKNYNMLLARYNGAVGLDDGWQDVKLANISTVSYFTAMRDQNKAAVFTAAAQPETWIEGPENKTLAADTWRFGADNGGANLFIGTIKSVRAYTRLLTDEELARNRAVDDARFFGRGAPATGAVIVQSAIEGLEGREASGLYFPDAWTFKAGASTQTARGLEWECAGYQLQTWDADNSCWGAQTAYESCSYTSPSGSDFASVRLTWLWKPVSGIRSAADFALDDYATGAVTWHLDGIEHGADATVWSDLSGNGRDATLAENAAFGADGLVLGNTDHARTAKTWVLGKATTTEVAFDVNFSSIPADGKMYVFVTPCRENATAGNGALYYKLGNRHIIWRTDKLTGTAWDTNAGVHDPTGAKFLTAIRNGSKTAVLTGTAYPTQTNVRGVDTQLYETWADGGASKVIDPYAWEIGRWVTDNYSIPGTIKSVRQYDRMLSEDELAWNRTVDSARFFGALATTNVVVVAGGGTQAEAAGEYQVFGSHEFTATTVVDRNGDTVKAARYRLETLVDGEWTNKTTVDGASYTYTAGSSPATVRLTWLARPRGMMIILR